ncbi:hypothetical protein FIBSPDRAFT_896490 [Athelia psychrophila]|uniref:Uncharacterized protein n=1 Tax=Athelia psychrophila TaxID=1759441 RepID=A0A166DEC1_9AGAM|nr:hypothetical protein FIBSPDRAFT_896490 [Fibularhizoctonia sp. CBS 109695]
MWKLPLTRRKTLPKTPWLKTTVHSTVAKIGRLAMTSVKRVVISSGRSTVRRRRWRQRWRSDVGGGRRQRRVSSWVLALRCGSFWAAGTGAGGPEVVVGPWYGRQPLGAGYGGQPFETSASVQALPHGRLRVVVPGLHAQPLVARVTALPRPHTREVARAQQAPARETSAQPQSKPQTQSAARAGPREAARRAGREATQGEREREVDELRARTVAANCETATEVTVVTMAARNRPDLFATGEAGPMQISPHAHNVLEATRQGKSTAHARGTRVTGRNLVTVSD